MAYTRLKYIESNGTQWIDSGFKPNQNTRIVVDFQGLKWNTNEVCMWMGVSSSPSFMFGKASSSNYRAYFYYKTSEVLFSESTAKEWETRQTLDWNKNVVTWGGISKSVSSSAFQCVDNAYLFAANNGGEAKFITRGRIYGCQIYDNDVLVRDYVPMANGQGVCGLYDNVSHVFYTSPNGNNFFGVREDNGLPVGYTQCEYIESNGTQYIDTGVIGQANIKAESEFMLMEGGASIPLGCYSPSRLYMISFDSNTYLRYGYSEWVNTSTKIEIGRKYSISVDFASGNQSMVLDGVTIASSSISGRVTNNYNIYAFAYNDGGRAGDFSKIRLYGLKLYQEGLLVRDYIPCQNSEGVCGLYDKVNGGFYTSPNGNSFGGKIEGQDLPIGYSKCEYIESNGTQYIDTGFNPDGNTRIVAEMQLTALVNADKGTSPMLFGAYASSSARYAFYWSSTGNVFGTYYAEQSKNFSSITNGYERVQIDCNKNTQSLNGETITYTASTSACSYPLYLFGRNTSGSAGFLAKAKLYSCQIYDNDILVRDFVPVVDNSGVCGLWDKVADKFYMSANGNNFVGKINVSELPVGYTLCEYIESDGTQYIDTGFKPTSENLRVDVGFTYKSTSSSQSVFGSQQVSPAVFSLVCYSNPNAMIYVGSSTQLLSTPISAGTRYALSVHAESGIVTASWDGVLSTAAYTGELYKLNSMFLFGNSKDGEPVQLSDIRLYSCQIYNNGMLVRDYVPCQDMYGVYGLYDLANNIFYQSASDYGLTGKWAEDKKLLVSPSEFRKRLMMLAVTDKKPDYSKLRGVFIEDIDGGLYTQNEWDGSKIPNGVAVLSNNCRFVVYGYYPQNGLFDYQGSILHNANYVYDSYPTFSYGYVTTDYNGQSNTDRICSMEGLDSWSIAVKCRNTVFPNGQYGYLAAAGEWKELLNNFNEVNNALSKAGMKRLDLYSEMSWLTSTCYMTGSAQYAQFFAFNMDYKNAETVSVYSEQFSRPLTKLKFDN